MTSALETMIAPLRQSPLLAEAVDTLAREMAAEKQLRAKFHQEMTPEQKIEFIGGEVIMHSPARNSHLDVTLNLSQLITPYVRKRNLGEVKVEKCLCVFPRNDYEPDLVFFGPEKAAGLNADTVRFPIPDFIVEVLSESSEGRDRGVKFEDFEAHGVAEYWIVDVEAEVVEQYLLEGEKYHLETKTGSGRITSRVIEGFEAPGRAFFDKQANFESLQQLLSE